MSTPNDHRNQDQSARDGNSSNDAQPSNQVSGNPIPTLAPPPIQVATVVDKPRYAIAQSAPDKHIQETQSSLVVDPLSDEPAPEVVPSPNRPWQFSISFLQVIFLIVAIASAMLGLVIKANLNDTSFFYYVLLLVIAPMGMMILLGMVKGGYVLWKQWREERKAIREMMDRGTPNQQPLHNDAEKF